MIYKEPSDYFPEEIRKKYGLGEYSEPDAGAKKKSAAKRRPRNDGRKKEN